MIYFTDPGETAGSVAAKFTSGNNADFAKQIRQKSRKSFAIQAMPGSNYFEADRAIWIPGAGDPPQSEIDAILDRMDWIRSDKRAILTQAQRQGVDIRDIVAAHKLTMLANSETKDNTIGLTAGAFAARTLDAVADFKGDRVSKFVNLLHQMKGNLKTMAEATSKDVRQAANQAYKSTYRDLNEQFYHEMKAYRLRGDTWFQKPFRFLREEEKDNAWEVWGESFARDAEDAAKNLRFLGWGAFAVDISLGISDTIEAYRKGKDWIKEAIKEGADIASYYAVYTLMGIAFVALGLTPVGWVALLVVGGIAAAGSMELNKLVINPYIENHVHI